MTCNCDNDGSNEYIIELGTFGVPGIQGEQGEPGYSPVVDYIWNNNTIQFTLTNANGVSTTPNAYDYLVSHTSLASTLAAYSTSAQIASTYLTKSDAATTYLKTDGSNATNPIAINGATITDNTTNTSIRNNNGLVLNNFYITPSAWGVQTNPESFDDQNFTFAQEYNTIKMRCNYEDSGKNQITISSNTNGTGSILGLTYSRADLYSTGNVYLFAGGKVYYGQNTVANKEIATIGDIPTVSDATITLTQGGVTKGTFTLNGSATTIDLDAGGGGSTYTAGTGIDITSDVISVNYNSAKGLSATGSTLEVRVDGTTVDFDSSGNLKSIAPSNMMTTDTNQSNISGNKTFHNAEIITDDKIVLVGSNGTIVSRVTLPDTTTTDYQLLQHGSGLVLLGNSTDDVRIIGASTRPTYGNATTQTITDLALYSDIPSLSGYATETWVGQQGYITGITSTDVTTALGYTPYSDANPNGYTTNIGTVTSVNNTSPDSNGDVTLSIPSYSAFTGATASTDGTTGLVTQPLTGDQDKYLKGDGTWGTPTATVTSINGGNA